MDTAGLVPASQHSLIDMVSSSGPLVQAVLVTLLVLSVLSWTVTFQKFLQFRQARGITEQFSEYFSQTRNLARTNDALKQFEGSPLAALFRSAFRELAGLKELPNTWDLELLSHTLRRTRSEETRHLEKGITFLATVASSAPFIGLFGTVWGIMNAFHGLGTAKAGTIQAVAPGISEALIATAVGLAAAIPAAVAYNYSVASMKYFRDAMDRFALEFLSVVKITAAKS